MATPAKKTTAKKAPAKKSVAKTAAKKSVAKKAPAKKATNERPFHWSNRNGAKKAAAKKAPAKKTAVKKTTTSNKEKRMSKELAVGSPVLVQVDPRQNGGSDTAAGVVVRAGEETVNVRVMLDSDENLYLRDVAVVKSAPKDEDKEQSEDETASEAKVRQRVCWPAK